MKLAAQMFTIRDFAKTEAEIGEALKKIKAAGYEGVQISGIGKYRPEWMADTVKELGLKVCACHIPLPRLVDDLDSVMAEYRAYGTEYIGLGYYAMASREDCDGLIKTITPIVQKLHDSGFKFLYHNHAHEYFKLSNGATYMQYIMENMDSKKFGLLLDFYWLHRAGIDCVEYAKQHSDFLEVVHFKDMLPPDKDKPENFAEIFCGNMNYGAIYNTCKEIGVKWVAVEQDICSGNPFESLAISAKNLKDRGMFVK